MQELCKTCRASCYFILFYFILFYFILLQMGKPLYWLISLYIVLSLRPCLVLCSYMAHSVPTLCLLSSLDCDERWPTITDWSSSCHNSPGWSWQTQNEENWTFCLMFISRIETCLTTTVTKFYRWTASMRLPGRFQFPISAPNDLTLFHGTCPLDFQR